MKLFRLLNLQTHNIKDLPKITANLNAQSAC